MTEPTRVLHHYKVDLALHQLRDHGDAHPLLLLHGLGERTPDRLPGPVSAWPGPVWGLDFAGHGGSTIPRGGGYTAELLMGDADAAVAALGPLTVCGRGIGAYVALLIAGARPNEVRGAVLADGSGLAGGGTSPGSPVVITPAEGSGRTPDPLALLELSRDVRPPDYALTYLRLAMQRSELEAPVAVSAVVRPPWLAAVADEPGVIECSVPEALARFAR